MKNLSIGARLSLGFTLVLILLLLITASGIWRLHALADTSRAMMQSPLATERYISDWSRTIHSGVRRTMAIAKSSDPSLVAFFADDTVATTKEAADLQKQIEPLIRTPEAKALWQQIQNARKNYLTSRDATVKAKQDGNVEEAQRLLDREFTPATKIYLDLVQKLLVMQRAEIDATSRHIDAMYDSGRNFLVLMGAAAILLGGLFSWLLTTGITRPLRAAVDIARKVASGDLRSDLKGVTRRSGKDETAQLMLALKEMNDSLLDTVGRVSHSVNVIAKVSGEIASGNRDLSARTEAQAASVQETAATVETLTEAVRKNLDSAQGAGDLVVSAMAVAKKGGAIVSGVVETMNSIRTSSTRVADIIGVIDGIAFQTNILALNAAVEAARAGEQGRGFAVVASEVRSLAQRSASAAKDIKTLIQHSVAEINLGNQQVAQAGTTMQDIVLSVQKIEGLMDGIMHASRAQSTGIDQVLNAIGKIDAGTQQNSALVEQAGATTASLANQVDELAILVSTFQLNGSEGPVPGKAEVKIEVEAKVAQSDRSQQTELRRLPRTRPALR